MFNWVSKFIEWLFNLFKPKPPPVPVPPPVHVPPTPVPGPVPPVPPTLPFPEPVPVPPTLPFPEEPMDTSQTLENTSVNAVLGKWFANYHVPYESQFFFAQSIEIKLYDAWPPEILLNGQITAETPAFTYADSRRHLFSLVKWFNPGVVAHEMAHNSYGLLSEPEKEAWERAFEASKGLEIVKLLHSLNTYMDKLSPDGRHLEGHADFFRFFGPDKMPDQLKQFYPKLIVEV